MFVYTSIFFLAFAAQIHRFEWGLDRNWSITIIGGLSNVEIHDIPLYPFIMMDFCPSKSSIVKQ